jgi:hypothetical protein
MRTSTPFYALFAAALLTLAGCDNDRSPRRFKTHQPHSRTSRTRTNCRRSVDPVGWC